MSAIALLVLACIVVAISAAVQTAIGFGLGIIAAPILVLIEPTMVPAPIVMIALCQLTITAWSNRSYIQWPSIWMASLGRLPGIVLALWLMQSIGIAGIKITIACAVLAAVLISLFEFQFSASRKNHLIAGFFSGFSGTTSSIGGPPMALLYQHQKGESVLANLSACFAIGSLTSLLGLGAAGFISSQSWLHFSYFLPGALIGTWLGLKLRPLIKPALMRPAILILCSCSAMALLIQTMAS